MAAIDITGAGGGITNVTGTSPVVVTIVGTARDVSLDQTEFKTINGNSIFGVGNIVIATGLTNWTEAFNSGTQATSSFTATNAATNVNAALVPKGTGAIVAQIPDGTITGGNARGDQAVDLQMNRSVSNQVASGEFSIIGGGAENRASARLAAVLSGAGNRVLDENSVICGGVLNLINASSVYHNVITGGISNTITSGTGGRCFIGAGESNVFSGNVRNSSILAGSTNTINGGNYGAILSGQNHNLSGTNNTIIGGDANTVAGFYNVCSGSSNTVGAFFNCGVFGDSNTTSANGTYILGDSNTASAQYAQAKGLRSNAYLYGQKAHANGRFTITGDAQGSEAILRLVDGFTDAQTKEIYLDGSSLRITGPTNSAMTVNIDIVAIVTAISGTATGVTVGDMFSQNEICAYKNIAGTGTVVGSQSIQKLHDASMAACDTAFATTGAALQVFFTGPNFAGGGTVTLRIVAKARIVETRY